MIPWWAKRKAATHAATTESILKQVVQQMVQGPKGDTGATGAKGDTGNQGVKGDTGTKGDKGDTGTQGIQGVSGAPWNPGTPVAMTPVFGTPRQAVDPAKPAFISINLRSAYSVTVASTQQDVIELRIGATTTGLADGTGGIVAGKWETSLTGIALTVGMSIIQGSPLCAFLPAGWYFCLRRVTTGTSTIVSAISQPAT